MSRKRAGSDEFYDILETPLGAIYLVFGGQRLTGISFGKPAGLILKHNEETVSVKRELTEYFEKGRREFTCRTAFIEGTDFEREVWNTLKEIPYGETRTYKWIAEKVGKPHAFRAAGNALGKNPIPIIFPCHRIIEADGSLGGYSGGIDIKRRLLEIEYYTKLSKN
jgi:methylated-DNA-[protein]-cysteine S-methyltransferase